MKSRLYIKEVEALLAKHTPRASERDLQGLRRYMNSISPLSTKLYGLPVPLQRNLATTTFSFSHLDPTEQLGIWNHIWNAHRSFESRSLALFAIEPLSKKMPPLALWKVIHCWAKTLDNWAHSDLLSSLYSKILEIHFKQLHLKIENWNESQNPWLRRQSLVSLFYYARARKVQPKLSVVLSLISKRIDDPDFYVQRGVGWTLREAFNVYPVATLKYLTKKCALLSPIAFATAIEKLSETQKKKLKEIRKNRGR
jgi:3-methyladenine DNA glycosylase AlkD